MAASKKSASKLKNSLRRLGGRAQPRWPTRSAGASGSARNRFRKHIKDA